jgi:hypothetical protein
LLIWALKKRFALIFGITAIGNHTDHFDSNLYKNWRKQRIAFLVKILGRDFFPGKNIIEFGAALGDVSAELSKLGAIVTICEGREKHVKVIKQRYPKLNCMVIDNDTDWSHFFKENQFDLVIHWGLLYHLDNWEKDLLNSLRVGKVLSLETEVLSSSDTAKEIKRTEFGDDQALHRFGTYVTSNSIESLFEQFGYQFLRYDDKSLNCPPYEYDWSPKENTFQQDGLRRFYMVIKSVDVISLD